jgi:hypothetical protein
MFGHLETLTATDDQLNALAKGLVDDNPRDAAFDNASIPSGYTYFGQFVDHDITYDPTPVPAQLVDPLAPTNFRPPRLDLDTVKAIRQADQP